MTLLAIAAYPVLTPSDHQWVESIRTEHDPQASRLGAHFTLVFPVGVPATDVEGEVAAVARTSPQIPFQISRAEVAEDLLGNGWRVFLVPDEGRETITALHRRLYAGVLRRHLRSDVPFVPHITVGASEGAEACTRLEQELNARRRIVRGRLESIDLLKVQGDRVESLGAYALGRGTAGGQR